MQPQPARAALLGACAMALVLTPAGAEAYETLHPFVGLTGDVYMGPFGYSYNYNFVVTGGGGVEVGLDSDFGWQVRLQMLGLAPQPPYLWHYWGGTADLRWVLPVPERQVVQPYFSIGGGYAHGTDVIGTFNEGIFELGTGIRFILGKAYIGLDAQWVNFTAGNFQLALGARF
jgi:hypothetical protein